MKFPAYMWYPGDWMKDPAVRSVGYAARGLWKDMLCLMHESPRRGYLQHDNGKPVSTGQLARMTGGSVDEVSRLLKELDNSGVFSRSEHGIIYSRRMIKDEQLRRKQSEYGKMGGNPKLLKGNLKGNLNGGVKARAKPNLTPSVSYSVSSSNKTSIPTLSPFPPSPQEVTAYAKEIGFDLDGARFCDHYEANGWMRGKSKIKSWKACVRTWKSNQSETASKPQESDTERRTRLLAQDRCVSCIGGKIEKSMDGWRCNQCSADYTKEKTK